MAEKGTVLLDVKRVTAGAGEKTILNGLNLKIKSGEIHVIMGPNGAGKSTLGHTIMGSPEYKAQKGHIVYKDTDITKLSADKRARLGIFMTFQDPIEVPGITLSAFIRNSIHEMTGKPIKIGEFNKKLSAYMDILKMDHSYAQRDLNVGFSGGEKKKAEILQMLMLNPELVILDETDSGLDVDAVRTVSEGVREFVKNGDKALLIITHTTKITEALNVDYTHVLVGGKIVKTGSGKLIDDINAEGFDKYIKVGEN